MKLLAALATGVAIGVYIGLRLVWAEEPETTSTVRDFGFWREFERVDSV